MKTKLIGVLIGVMLMTTMLAVAKPSQIITEDTSTDIVVPTSYSADVPVWEIGDQWNYKIDTIALNFSQEGQIITLVLSIAELPLKVTDVTGDYYTLTFETVMNGQGHIYMDQGDGPINVSISFSSVVISGVVRIEKSTLGIKEISVSSVKQKVLVEIIDIPNIQLPTWLHRISAKITLDATINSDTPVALLSFPLNTGTYWNLSGTNFSITGTLQSPWLNLIYFLNKIGSLVGFEFLPPEFAALLPIVDFNDALTTLIGGNIFQIPALVGAFICMNTTEDITVPAGTYDSYNITIFGGAGQCYYAPAAGNVIKIKGNFGDVIPYITTINMELLSTTYS
jgi:hypothetical protein